MRNFFLTACLLATATVSAQQCEIDPITGRKVCNLTSPVFEKSPMPITQTIRGQVPYREPIPLPSLGTLGVTITTWDDCGYTVSFGSNGYLNRTLK